MSKPRFEDLSRRLADFAAARDWEQFHAPKNLAMALAAESGELLEHFQWLTEGQSAALSAQELDAVSLELADVQLYLVRLADRLGVDLWSFASSDGASIRVAVDYLLPYTDPAREWPHAQITPAKRIALVPVARTAAVAYREPRYFAACASLGAEARERNEHRLILPDEVVGRAIQPR